MSLALVIDDPAHTNRETLHFAFRDFQRAVQDGRYKLIEYVVDGVRTSQLFDLQADPFETTDLAADSQYATHLTRLRRQLMYWKDELDDPTAFWDGYDPER